LNAQLSNGNFLVPAPQNASTGASTFSSPCKYTDDQFVSNLDVYTSDKSHFSGKFFFMNSDQTAPFPGNQFGVPAASLAGFPQTIPNGSRNFSLTHTYALSDHLLNQAILGFHRTTGALGQGYPKTSFANTPACAGSVSGPFTLSSICVPAPSFDNSYPGVIVTGSLSAEQPTQSIGFNLGGNGQGVVIAQNFYDFSDSVTYVRGKHSLHFGGEYRNVQYPTHTEANGAGSFFFSDLNTGLLGIPSGNSMASFLLGDVASASATFYTLPDWKPKGDAFGWFVSDNWKATSKLSLTLGLRWDVFEPSVEKKDRTSFFDPVGANPGAGPDGWRSPERSGATPATATGTRRRVSTRASVRAWVWPTH